MRTLSRLVRRASFAIAALVLVFFAAATAQENNVVGGYAVNGHDPVACFRAGQPTPGDDGYTGEYNEAKYRLHLPPITILSSTSPQNTHLSMAASARSERR